MQLVLCKDTHNSKQEKNKAKSIYGIFYLFFHLLIMYAKRSRIPFRP